MNSHPKKALAAARIILVGLILALASALCVDQSNILGEYGNLCGPESDQPCLLPREAAGYPIFYLIDKPGISVEHAVSFAEDEFRISRFITNVLFWSLMVLFLDFLGKRSLRRQKGNRA